MRYREWRLTDASVLRTGHVIWCSGWSICLLVTKTWTWTYIIIIIINGDD